MFKLKEIIKWPSGKQILFRRGKHRAYSCRDANFFSKAYLLTPWIKIKTKPIASTIDSIAERKSRITRLIIAIIWIFSAQWIFEEFRVKNHSSVPKWRIPIASVATIFGYIFFKFDPKYFQGIFLYFSVWFIVQIFMHTRLFTFPVSPVHKSSKFNQSRVGLHQRSSFIFAYFAQGFLANLPIHLSKFYLW